MYQTNLFVGFYNSSSCTIIACTCSRFVGSSRRTHQLVDPSSQKNRRTCAHMAMVFNATFNNISAISWRSVLL